MKIQQISTQHLQIPLRIRFSQANNATSLSDSIILKVETEKTIVGYGEACPRLYVTGEDSFSVEQDVSLLQEILGTRSIETIADIHQLVTQELPSQIGLATICALEVALLDAWSQETQTNLLSALGANPNPVIRYSGVAPMGSKKTFQHIIQKLRYFDFQEVKLKVGTDLADNLEKINMIKAAYPTETRLRVDANCSWSLQDALTQIPVLAEAGIHTFEQIFPKGEEENMGKITEQFGDQVNIMADESLTSLESARYLLENKLCNHFNLKLSKNGGIFNSLAIYELAREYGVGCQLGAHFGETSLLTAAGILFASVVQDLTAVEGGLGTHLLEYDVCENPLQINQQSQISNYADRLQHFGIGVQLAEKVFAK